MLLVISILIFKSHKGVLGFLSQLLYSSKKLYLCENVQTEFLNQSVAINSYYSGQNNLKLYINMHAQMLSHRNPPTHSWMCKTVCFERAALFLQKCALVYVTHTSHLVLCTVGVHNRSLVEAWTVTTAAELQRKPSICILQSWEAVRFVNRPYHQKQAIRHNLTIPFTFIHNSVVKHFSRSCYMMNSFTKNFMFSDLDIYYNGYFLG